MKGTDQVQLVFREPPKELFASRLGTVEPFAASVDQVESWFKRFKISQIELWIEAVGKTGPLINLFVSAEGKGGLKVTLKPAE